jgi:hypothetical protein
MGKFKGAKPLGKSLSFEGEGETGGEVAKNFIYSHPPPSRRGGHSDRVDTVNGVKECVYQGCLVRL